MGGLLPQHIYSVTDSLSLYWGIIISKILQLKRDKKNAAFVKAFNSAEDILEFCDVNKQRDGGLWPQDCFEEVVNVQQKFEKDYPELNFADSQMKVLKEDFDNMVKHTVDRVSNQMAERKTCFPFWQPPQILLHFGVWERSSESSMHLRR